MLKRIYLSLLFFLYFFFSYSQKKTKGNSLKTYCLARNSLIKLRNINLDTISYNTYFNMALITPDDYVQKEAFKFAAYYYAKSDTLRAFEYVKAAVNKGAQLKCINGVFTGSELKILQNLRVNFIKQNYNQAAFSFFEILHSVDQVYRTSTNPHRREKMKVQDKVNQLLLTEYIQKNGWPNHKAFDTTDCSFTISSALGSMLSHWDIPYSNFIYRTMVLAARRNILPWFIPINVNNLFLSRKPFISGNYYNFLNWGVSYNQLNNLKITNLNQLDLDDDFTIADILSMCFRTYKASDILFLVPSRQFAKNKENCRLQLEKLKSALLFLGLTDWQVTVFDFEKNEDLLSDTSIPISYWNIHYGTHPTVSSMYKDTWILDKEFSGNDFTNLFK